MRAILACLALLLLLLAGCTIQPNVPCPGAIWVPGHYGPRGWWIPAHWRCPRVIYEDEPFSAPQGVTEPLPPGPPGPYYDYGPPPTPPS